MEPQLFKAAMEDQLRKLSEEKEAKEAAEAAAREQQGDKEASASDLVLYQRMQEVRRQVLYSCYLQQRNVFFCSNACEQLHRAAAAS